VDEYDIRLILGGAVEGWIVAEEIAKRDVSVIITPRDKRRPNEDSSAPSGSTMENAAILKKAGVKFAIVPPSTAFTIWGGAGRDLMTLPIEAAFEIFEKSRMKCSGLAKRARLVMSHSTGKIEIVGCTDDNVYMRYHRAANPQEKARFMIFRRNPDAYWFDDYDEIIKQYSIRNPYRTSGPE